MEKIIDKYAETIPSTQSRIALEILKGKRDSGAINTQEEYAKAMQDFLSGASRDRPKPLITVTPMRQFAYASSADYNYMLKTIEGDLQVIFVELEAVAQMTRAHKEVYLGSVLNDLARVIDALDQEISKLDVKSAEGIQASIVNNFSQKTQMIVAKPLDRSYNGPTKIDISDPKDPETLGY